MAESPEPRKNGLEYDPDQKAIVIKLYMDVPSAVCMALGSLEIAKDQVKIIYAQLAAAKRASKTSLIVPGENGNGGGIHAI